MKHRFLFAIFLTWAGFSAEARTGERGETTLVRQQIVLQETAYVLPDSINTRSAADARRLAPVAEQISRQRLARPQPTVSGILPRITTAERPAEMISPFAPRDLGAGWNLMTFTDRDPYRTVTPNKNHPQPTGLRVMGWRGIW